VDDDRERERRIASLLTGPARTVQAVAYPTSGTPGVLQLYLRDGDDELFACVLMTRARYRQSMVVPAAITLPSSEILGTPDVQVVPLDDLNATGVLTAARAWVEHVCPQATATLVLEPPDVEGKGT